MSLALLAGAAAALRASGASLAIRWRVRRSERWRMWQSRYWFFERAYAGFVAIGRMRWHERS
jgi:hypothetical protein